MPPKQPAKKKVNGYTMPQAITPGEVLTDLAKKQWTLGPSIGKGGFGEIYSAKDSTSKDYKYVIKIEPHSNGPLFVEMHFYIKFGKADMVEEFRKEKKLKTFGMPVYHGHGSHEYKNEKYRFLVLDRLGTDLDKIYLDNKKKFDAPTVFKLAVQILDVLEYIHRKEYVHADIKGANILLGTKKETKNQAYLVDFGLACKYTTESVFKPNPKKAHDGTIEYLSRDAHKGVQTRRGDLEILAYNIIHWLGCTLPWMKKIGDPNAVHASKTESMNDIPAFMKTCFHSKQPPAGLLKFLNYINALEHNTQPDYKKVRDIFIKEVVSAGDSLDQPFNFADKPSRASVNRRSSLKRRSSARFSFTVKPSNVTIRRKVPLKDKLDTAVIMATKKVTSSKAQVAVKNKLNTAVIKETKTSTSTKAQVAIEVNGDPYDGFTPEMRAIMEKKKAKGKTQKVTKKKVVKPKRSNSPSLAVKIQQFVNGKNDIAGSKGSASTKGDSDTVIIKPKTKTVRKAKPKPKATPSPSAKRKSESLGNENDEIKNIRKKIARTKAAK